MQSLGVGAETDYRFDRWQGLGRRDDAELGPIALGTESEMYQHLAAAWLDDIDAPLHGGSGRGHDRQVMRTDAERHGTRAGRGVPRPRE